MRFDKNFKMHKLTKIMLSNIHDDTERSVVRKLFCEAEYSYAGNKKKMAVKHVVDTASDD